MYMHSISEKCIVSPSWLSPINQVYRNAKNYQLLIDLYQNKSEHLLMTCCNVDNNNDDVMILISSTRSSTGQQVPNIQDTPYDKRL